MRTCRLLVAAALVTLVGCALPQVKVVEELPDPVVGTTRTAVQPDMPSPPPRRAATAPAAGWIPPGGISSRWTAIVIHHSASEHDGAASIDQYHRINNGWDELGYHFVIGNGSESGDGQIEVGSRWIKQKHGAHAKTPDNYYNDHGVGICLIGNFEDHPPTPAQMRALARLVRFLMAQTGIPATEIYGHSDLKATACPGRFFPLDRFRREMMAPTWASSE
jgi:hypothetical protein